MLSKSSNNSRDQARWELATRAAFTKLHDTQFKAGNQFNEETLKPSDKLVHHIHVVETWPQDQQIYGAKVTTN